MITIVGVNFLHNHEIQEKALKLSEGHVIVDRGDWEKVLDYFTTRPSEIPALLAASNTLRKPNFDEILKAKIAYYGDTDAANEFAHQEYQRQMSEYEKILKGKASQSLEVNPPRWVPIPSADYIIGCDPCTDDTIITKDGKPLTPAEKLRLKSEDLKHHPSQG